VLFKWLFGRRPPRWLDEQHTDYNGLGIPKRNADETVANEYTRLVANVLRGWGVPEECAAVDVHQMGEMAGGRKVYVAAVRLVSWERKAGLRLLLGLPFLERKIRKTAGAHWVAEVSHFAGVWLNATDRINDMGAQADLRQLLVTLTHRRGSDSELPSGFDPDQAREKK
jgi:hypothetical protein